VGCYVALLPVQFALDSGMRLAPSDAFLFLYLIAAAPDRHFLRTRVWSGWHPAILLTFSLATLTSLMRFGEVTRYMLLNKDMGMLVLFAAYAALTGEARDWEAIRRILRVFVVSVAIMNAVALVSFYGGAPLLAQYVFPVAYTGRLAGMLIDPNAYGGLLVVALAIHVTTFYSTKPILGGAWGVIVTITLAAGILLTYSRSAWIGAICVLLGLLVVNRRAAASVIVTVAAIVGVALASADQSTVDNMIEMAARPQQVEDRVQIVSKAIPMFLESPVWGIGLGTFYRFHNIIIHNTPIWFLTEFGVFGFIVFAGFITWFWRRGFAAYRFAPAEEKALVFALIAAHTAILGLSMGVEAFYQRHWWLSAALIAASYSLTRRDDRECPDC